MDYNLFEAWGRRANDPETEVHKWIKEGVPLGIELPIKSCGIFPPTLKGDELQEGGELQAAQGLRAVVEQEEDAKVEIDRLIHCGYAVKVKKEEAERKSFKGATISKLAVAEEEKGHCLAPALDGDHWLLFVALLFGYKTAPLTWSRVAALVARLVQSIPAERGMHQVYLDDSLWVLCGTLAARNSTLACILTTMAALGLKLSLAKGERSAAVTWIGVNFKLVARQPAGDIARAVHG